MGICTITVLYVLYELNISEGAKCINVCMYKQIRGCIVKAGPPGAGHEKAVRATWLPHLKGNPTWNKRGEQVLSPLECDFFLQIWLGANSLDLQSPLFHFPKKMWVKVDHCNSDEEMNNWTAMLPLSTLLAFYSSHLPKILLYSYRCNISSEHILMLPLSIMLAFLTSMTMFGVFGSFRQICQKCEWDKILL